MARTFARPHAGSSGEQDPKHGPIRVLAYIRKLQQLVCVHPVTLRVNMLRTHGATMQITSRIETQLHVSDKLQTTAHLSDPQVAC